MTMSNRWIAMIVAIAAVLGNAAEALAEEGVLEEIIVTATKREASLQEVPLAVTSFSAETMKNDGVFNIVDLNAATPGLNTATLDQGSPSGANINIRGFVGADDILLSVDPAVTTYLDGAAMQNGFGLRANFFDLERVEILKGPQGTLYGKNNTGGSINLISRKADFEGVHGFLTADVGNYSNFDFTGAVNVPLIQDVAAVRIAAQRNSRDGFGKHTDTCYSLPANAPGLDPGTAGESCSGSQDLGDDEEWNFRGNLLIQPNEKVTVSIVGDFSEFDQNDNMLKWVGWVARENIDVAPEGTRQAGSELYGIQPDDLTDAQLDFVDDYILNTLLPSFADDPFDSAGGNASQAGFGRARGDVGSSSVFDKSKVWGVSTTVTIDLNEATSLKSITSYREFDNDRNTEIGGTPFIIHESPQDGWGDMITQEFNLSGENLGGALRWIGGAFYSSEEGNDGSTSFARPAHSGAPWGAVRGELENKAWAVFAQAEYDLTPDLTFTAGGRYTKETRDMRLASHVIRGVWDPITKTSTPVPTGGFPPQNICLTGGGFTDTPLEDKTAPAGSFVVDGCGIDYPKLDASGSSWTFALNYDINDDLMVYARSSRGFRSGAQPLRDINFGITSFDIDFARQQLRPEKVQDIEIGFKGDFLDNRARANLAVFTAKFDDKHEAFLQPGAALSTVLQNAAEAEINGLELEVLASPLNGLTLRGTLAWLDAKYKKFEEVQPNAGGLGIAEVVDRAGDTLEGTREWTYSLMSRYETPIGDIGTLGLQANWSWASKAEEDRFSTVLLAANRGQTELFEIFDRGNDSRGLLNMRVDFEIPDWGANIAFYCTNCTDKTIWQQGAGLASRQYISQLVGPPRMWGFQVTKRFGE